MVEPVGSKYSAKAKELERISKPYQHNDHVSKLYKSVKQVGIILVLCNERPKVLKPTNRPFDFPSSTISPQFATVLCVGLPSVMTMWANLIDFSTLHTLS